MLTPVDGDCPPAVAATNLGGSAFAAVGFLAAVAAAATRSGQRPLGARAFAVTNPSLPLTPPHVAHTACASVPASSSSSFAWFAGGSASSTWWPCGQRQHARNSDEKAFDFLGARSRSHRSKPPGVLRVSFQEYSAEELLQALRRIGVKGFDNILNGQTGNPSKQQLVQIFQALDVPARHITDSLRSGRSAANSKRSRQRKQPSPRGRNGHRFDEYPGELRKYRPDQLKSALNKMGVRGTSTWTKRRLVNRLQDLGVSPQDLRQSLVSGNRDFPRGGRRGGSGPASCGQRWQERKPRQDSRRGRSSGTPPQRAGSWTYIGFESVDDLAGDDIDDFDDFDDFEDFTIGGEKWDRDGDDEDYDVDPDYMDPSNVGGGVPPDWHWEASGPNFRTYSADASDFGVGREEAEQEVYRERQSFWRNANLRQPSPSTASHLSSSPEEIMVRALTEGWSSSKLTRLQALQLLGLRSVRPSDQEVRTARRFLAQRWHPDRNPDDAAAASAFQLIMAACEKLS